MNRDLTQTKIRLAEWAQVLRELQFMGAPNPHCYSQQAFTVPRVDFDHVRETQIFDERAERAEKVHAIVQEMKGYLPLAATALECEYTTWRPAVKRPIKAKEKLEQFKYRTGLSKSAYYRWSGVGRVRVDSRLASD